MTRVPRPNSVANRTGTVSFAPDDMACTIKGWLRSSTAVGRSLASVRREEAMNEWNVSDHFDWSLSRGGGSVHRSFIA